MNKSTAPRTQFASWVRAASVVWLAVWVPAYAHYWGWANFLHLCDVAAALTCLGFLFSNSLLLSTQAVSSLIAGGLWCIDAGWTWMTGAHVVGGTEYMWDASIPLWVRLLSLFHLALPIALLLGLRRAGYHRGALFWQSVIALTLLLFSLRFGPRANLNFVYRDPVLRRTLGGAPAHFGITFLALVGVLYWPAHAILRRVFDAPEIVTVARERARL
jgi:hypothetical protein